MTDDNHDTGPEAAEESADHVSVELPPEEVAARRLRLLEVLQWVGDPPVTEFLHGLSDTELKAQPMGIRMALQTLKRKRGPARFLDQPQYRSTVPLIAEALSDPCQEAVVAALGDHADDPDRDQLLAALAEVGGDYPPAVVALTLAFVSVTDMTAAAVCDEILRTDTAYRVPEPGN